MNFSHYGRSPNSPSTTVQCISGVIVSDGPTQNEQREDVGATLTGPGKLVQIKRVSAQKSRAVSLVLFARSNTIGSTFIQGSMGLTRGHRGAAARGVEGELCVRAPFLASAGGEEIRGGLWSFFALRGANSEPCRPNFPKAPIERFERKFVFLVRRGASKLQEEGFVPILCGIESDRKSVGDVQAK